MTAEEKLLEEIISRLDKLGAGFQPLDSDLTAIAALTTTAFGRSLLTLSNNAALAALVAASFDAAGSAATAETNAKAYADGLVVGLWDDRGNFDASVNAYPSSGGSGVAGAIKKGDIWTISVAGVLPTGLNVEIGDTVRALIDTPGNTQANWAIAQQNIGYVAENQANKSTNIAADTGSNIKYPSVAAVETAIAAGALGYERTNVDAVTVTAGTSNDFDFGDDIPTGDYLATISFSHSTNDAGQSSYTARMAIDTVGVGTTFSMNTNNVGVHLSSFTVKISVVLGEMVSLKITQTSGLGDVSLGSPRVLTLLKIQ